MGCVPNKGVTETTSKSAVVGSMELEHCKEELICYFKAKNKLFRFTLTKDPDSNGIYDEL